MDCLVDYHIRLDFLLFEEAFDFSGFLCFRNCSVSFLRSGLRRSLSARNVLWLFGDVLEDGDVVLLEFDFGTHRALCLNGALHQVCVFSLLLLTDFPQNV